MLKQREHLFERSNEWVPAIVEVLSPHDNEPVLAVVGSGDQPFALLPANVYGVDIDQRQVSLAHRRADLLREGLLEEFLGINEEGVPVFENPREFFSPHDLRRATDYLDRLVLACADVFNPPFSGPFSKAYVSNAWRDATDEGAVHAQDFLSLSRVLTSGALVYSSIGLFSSDIVATGRFTIVDSLTCEARRAEERMNHLWLPTVYRYQ